MAKNILYIGGFNFNKTTASSIRVIENARFLEKLNFNVEVLGKIQLLDKKYTTIDTIKVSNIVADDEDFASNISTIKLKVTSSKIEYIIAYNYPPIAFYKLLKLCKINNVTLIPDLTEWYGIDGDFSIGKGVRFILHQWRMLYLNKQCKNKIVASSFLDRYYKKSNNLLLPFVTIDVLNFKKQQNLNIDAIKFVYAGSPGENFSKDRLDIVLKSFAKVKEIHSNFMLNIVGLTKENLLAIDRVKKEVQFLDQHLNCFGRLDNVACVNVIKQSDIVVFARDVNRVSSAGFPTKVFEAFKYGLPILTNRTSDIDNYVEKNYNGFLTQEANVKGFLNAIQLIVSADIKSLEKIIDNCRSENPFFYKNYMNKTELFFKKTNT
tara:strand:+ start:5033 stop:6166 length:1134 start_codon:yes stop_codon:yes gene_type:complete